MKRYFFIFLFFTVIFTAKAQENDLQNADISNVLIEQFQHQRNKDTKEDPLLTFPSGMATPICLDYDLVREGLWIANEEGNGLVPLLDITDGSLILNLDISAAPLGSVSKTNGIDVLANGNLLFTDYRGDLSSIYDYIFEIDPTDGSLVNYWPTSETMNTSTDGTDISYIADIAIGPNGNAYVTNTYNNYIYQIELIPGLPGTWSTVEIYTAPTAGSVLGIDYFNDNWIFSDTPQIITISDNSFNKIFSIDASHSGNIFNSGTCFIENVNPLQLAVVDYGTDEVAIFNCVNINIKTITFRIDDGTTAIDGAEIDINGGTYTTTAGEVKIELLEDTYTYTVTADGFDDFISTYSVTAEPNQTVTVHMTETISVKDLITGEISIYPNPSNGVFNINVESIFNLEVFDITGKVINKHIITGSSIVKINTAGIYFLRFSNNNTTVVQRVIVK